MLGIGAYLVIADKASGGIMIASSILMGRALAPVEIALGTWKQLAAARQGLVRLRDILKVTAQPPAPPVKLPRPSRELSVQNLAVAAPGFDMPIVSGVTFSLKAGWGWRCSARARRARPRSRRRWLNLAGASGRRTA